MSGTKRYMDHLESQRSAAISIALQAGVLKKCENHSDVIFDGGADIKGAYALGNHKLKNDADLKNLFDSPREMTDTVKRVVEEHHLIDKCPRCEKFLAD